MENRFVLGIWDGHDAGAALLCGDEIVFAINEERLSRRKLEVGFPTRSIEACLKAASLAPSEIGAVAASTTDPAKTLTRLVPSLKEEYYLLRRRKIPPRPFDSLRKVFKYRFTELHPNCLSRALSRSYLTRKLRDMGFAGFALHLVDHHAAHAAAAAYCSGYPECLTAPLDGVGDGLSGSLWTLRDGSLTLLRALPASVSLGIFFEHVTNLMNMRELEDEGKVMALANYAYPVADGENPLLAIITAEGLDLKSPYSSTSMFREMKKILWRYPSEQFAFMAQRALEKNALALITEALARTKLTKIAVAGGVFSNIKLNMSIADLPQVERICVFPHMGDGGLALGAAMSVNRSIRGVTAYKLNDLSLGPSFRREEILQAIEQPLAAGGVRVVQIENAPKEAARLILDGEIILWFQGRMEIGPRALGNRSILARPDDRQIKDRLNRLLKKRVWYQPFCPSMLAEDAPFLLHMEGQEQKDNRFMTMAFRAREEKLPVMEGVINIDGTCRPHFVGEENLPFRELLRHIKKELGCGLVLNTSFNIHGDPMVCSPREALETLGRTGIRYLFMGDILVENVAPQSL